MIDIVFTVAAIFFCIILPLFIVAEGISASLAGAAAKRKRAQIDDSIPTR